MSLRERERERARSALDLEQASKRERGACPKPLHHSPGERKKRGLWFNFQGSGYMFRAKGCNYRLGLRLINSTFNPKPDTLGSGFGFKFRCRVEEVGPKADRVQIF